MFNLTDLNDAPKGGSIYLNGGINENAEIMEVSASSSQAGNPMITVHIANGSNTNVDTNKDAKKFTFPISDKAFTFGGEPMTPYQMTMTKLLHLNNAVCKKAEFINIATETGVDGSSLPTLAQVEDFASRLNDLWRGHSFRLKLIKREYLNAENVVKVTADISLAPFAEPTEDDAEYAAVETTKLTYVEGQGYDFQKLKGPRPQAEGNLAAAATVNF